MVHGSDDIFYMIHVVPLRVPFDGHFMVSAAPLQGPGGAIPYNTLNTGDLTDALLSITNPPKEINRLMRDITAGKAVSLLAFLSEDDLRELRLAD